MSKYNNSIISHEFINTLLDDHDMVKIIEDHVTLKKSGSSYLGKSPFNSEKTPSFRVNPVKSIWKDFSSGKGGSNAISFLMALNYSFPDAIKHIAAKEGKQVIYDDSEKNKEFVERKAVEIELKNGLQDVEILYSKQLNDLNDQHPAKKQLANRGYGSEIIARYGLGFAPGGNFLLNHCKLDFEKLNLKTDKGETFRERIIYPLHDKYLNALGFAGRTISEKKSIPKWINPSNTEIYNKSGYLYGISQAIDAIRKENKVWLVEGYNDVIAWQTNGIENTLGICGTATTQSQIKTLKTLCNHIMLCLDADNAGRKATIKIIPELIKLGFQVDIVDLKNGDPDEFIQKNKEIIKIEGISNCIDKNCSISNGFKYLCEAKIKGSTVQQAKQTEELCQIISEVENEILKDLYAKTIGSFSDVKKITIDKLVKSFSREIKENGNESKYTMPNGIELTDDIQVQIENYSIFQTDDCIYVLDRSNSNNFKAVSNCSIHVIMHMQDETFPAKLLKIRNNKGHNKIFDTPSDSINTKSSIDRTLTNQGNFLWKGTDSDLQKLKEYVFSKMGSGKKIEVLGWQPENFWVWNNMALTKSGEIINIDENGVLEFEKSSYYIPSKNINYVTNYNKYTAQKNFIHIDSKVTFAEYSQKVYDVFGGPGITALLFTIASIFQDVVIKENNAFPMYSLFGIPSTGKSFLATICKSFFGIPEKPISIGGGQSTNKANIRVLAQFNNSIAHFDEYTNGDAMTDEILKSVYDRTGYKYGTIESRISIEQVPIASNTLITGNQYPLNDALITRCIVEEFTKVDFTAEETLQYESLLDMTNNGISSFTTDILKHRTLFEKQFSDIPPIL